MSESLKNTPNTSPSTSILNRIVVDDIQISPNGISPINFRNWKSVVFIGSHPDDIEMAAGGLISHLAERNTQILLIVATLGEYGFNPLHNHPPARLAEIRQTEQRDSGKILGADVLFLEELEDQGLWRRRQAFSQQLEDIMRDNQFDAVFTWDPQSPYFAHPDHVATAYATRQAQSAINSGASPQLFLFLPQTPTHYHQLLPDSIDFRTKEEALKQHASQMTYDMLRFSRQLAQDAKRLTGISSETFREILPHENLVYPPVPYPNSPWPISGI